LKIKYGKNFKMTLNKNDALLRYNFVHQYSEKVLIKGRLQVLTYSFTMNQVFNQTLPKDLLSASKEILHNLNLGNKLISKLSVGRHIDYFISPRNKYEASEIINALLNPILNGQIIKLQQPVNNIFDIPYLWPYPLKYASVRKFSHTLAWIDSNIKILIEDLLLPIKVSSNEIKYLVNICFVIYSELIKADNFYLADNMNFNHSIFFQERIIELLLGINLYNVKEKIEVGQLSNKITLKYLQELGDLKLPELKVLSVFMGVIWTSSPELQNDFDGHSPKILSEIEKTLNIYKDNMVVDDFEYFITDITNRKINNLIVILDDNGESVYDLAIIQKILKLNSKLKVTFVLNSTPVSVNISIDTFKSIIAEKYFHELNEEIKNERVVLHVITQYFRSFDYSYFSKQTKKLLSNADGCYIKGLNFFETMQLKDASMYYCFTVYGENAINLTGFKQFAGLFVHVPKGSSAFNVNDDSSIVTLKELREKLIDERNND